MGTGDSVEPAPGPAAGAMTGIVVGRASTPSRRLRRPSVTVACAHCGTSFTVQAHRAQAAKFCSRTCQGMARRAEEFPCATCQAPVRRSTTRPNQKYCSLACRDAAGRAEVTCRQCGTAFTMKASEAAARLFCSRACMQAAWRCAWCAKLVPTDRQATSRYCSQRCDLSAELDGEAQATGVRRAYCFACHAVKPQEAFYRDRTTRNGLDARCKACTRIKYEETKDAYRLRRYRYKAAAGGQIIAFTPEQKAARFAMWGGRCWRCGIAEATEEDHVKPIAKGGSHCLANLRPICQKCNTTKRDLWPLPSAWSFPGFRHPDPAPGSDRERRRPREDHQVHTCPQCLRVAMMPAYWARTHIYCSPACHYVAMTLPPVVLVCAGCQREVTLPGHQANVNRRFCSNACANPFRGNRARRARNPDADQLALWD
ncbi:HNH endonuclease [Terrabacter sp. 2YAF2]|uniref:HNH endonuclease n=1 Tax=Terrabacter sp. 2YAF2 TaxID=3233026 RepID=UPI003F97047D